jgi:hypothetical protein
MKTFDDLKFNTNSTGVYHAKLEFENGFGVTVSKGEYTQGGDIGLYELEVIKDGEPHYNNKISNGDVVGYLRPEDITDVMLIIQKF